MTRAMFVGYVLTVLIETPVLLALMRARPLRVRLAAGLGLTALSYPVVGLAIPPLLDPTTQRLAYLAGAETAAPLIECLAFRACCADATRGELAAIVLANLASFAAGELGLSRMLADL